MGKANNNQFFGGYYGKGEIMLIQNI